MQTIKNLLAAIGLAVVAIGLIGLSRIRHRRAVATQQRRHAARPTRDNLHRCDPDRRAGATYYGTTCAGNGRSHHHQRRPARAGATDPHRRR